MKAYVNVLESPKAMDSTAVATRPKMRTKRLPWRSATSPQTCDEKMRPIMKPDDNNPAKKPGAVSYTHLTLPTICSV